ncbi:hypothetical protein [Sinisalibacter aestuarii]|uniref:Lipocalin-like domain-containing protein n=1 Tax=Sinisalibacter aestuarii TaxID=2949426 RepID=A0ABQ5LMK3_9RHOB|nr:hypothetical protein [Sinisalibacter aestuarii]GKY86255.1 hypothetical protein STA1M1_01240 [Sinisalibacter aestuarii]
MRRIVSALSLALILPLAACFDADLSISFIDDNTAEGTMVMTATPEFYAMASSGTEPFCEDVEATLEDGSHTCTETFSGTIDEILNDPDMAEGMTIARNDDGTLFVAFDLGDMTQDVAPPEEAGAEADQMKEMMKAAFMGHFITVNVSGAEIIETNGTVSEDGATATFTIPLETLLADHNDMPEAFEVLLRPGA